MKIKRTKCEEDRRNLQKNVTNPEKMGENSRKLESNSISCVKKFQKNGRTADRRKHDKKSKHGRKFWPLSPAPKPGPAPDVTHRADVALLNCACSAG